MSAKKPPKNLDDKLVGGKPMWREIARKIRDRQWRMMEEMDEHGTLWVCMWNKRSLPTAEDEFRDGLLGWEEKQSWFTDQHPDWFVIGGRDEYDEKRRRLAVPADRRGPGRSAGPRPLRHGTRVWRHGRARMDGHASPAAGLNVLRPGSGVATNEHRFQGPGRVEPLRSRTRPRGGVGIHPH